MKNKSSLIVLVLVTALIIGGAYYLYQRLSPNAALDTTAPADYGEEEKSSAGEGSDAQAAADFSVYNADGGEVTFSSLLGKPVVLNFWASWCGPCKSEMPHFQEAYEQYGEDVTFVMVNLTGGGGDSIEDAQKLISSNGYTFPVYFDNDGDAAAKYSVYSIPYSFFITADGLIQDPHLGMMSEDELTAAIEKLLKASD